MKVMSEIVRSIVGLFIDDGFLAIGIVAIVAMTAGLIFVLEVTPLLAGIALLGGNIVVLVVGAWQTTNRRRRRVDTPSL
jgi:hypothetical protein